jgi:translation elongation factor P/translation initiation factor 5A
VKPGKGAAFIRTKLKNYLTGNTVDKTFRAGSSVMHLRFSNTFVFSMLHIVG